MFLEEGPEVVPLEPDKGVRRRVVFFIKGGSEGSDPLCSIAGGLLY